LGEADCRGLNRDRCGGANVKLRSSKKFPCHDSTQEFKSNTAFGLLYHAVQESLFAGAFFSPLIAMVGSCPPITAPALTIVGAMMMQNVSKIDWKDYTESIPACLILIGIRLSYSIADGLSLGFISYPIIKALSGREVSWLTYLLAIVLLLYFVFVRGRMA
jgi:AGZA family xanthine/uracil permease-like MFS transporter